jgi:hypothetical protein
VKERERWKRRSEEERREGLSETDAGARYLAAADSGRAYRAGTRWRTKPISSAQARELRRLGLNPLAYRNAGEASDAITKKKR